MTSGGRELPEGWAWATLGDVGRIVSGGTPSTKHAAYWGGEISWVTPADLSGYTAQTISRGERNLTEEGLAACSAVLMPEGSVLFSSRAPIGYVAIASNPIATNQGFKSIVPFEVVSSGYLYHYLKGSKELAEAYASGTTFKEISAKRFKQLPVPLAPIPEQHRIVDKIEELFSGLDAGEAALEKTERLLEHYRQSVLKAAVEGELTREWRQQNPAGESADELLERILEERRARWEADQLAKYEAKGKTPPKGWKDRYKPPAGVEAEGLPELPKKWRWVSMDALLREGLRNGRSGKTAAEGIRVITLTAVTDGDFSESNTKLAAINPRTVKDLWLEPGDVLIERSNTPELVGTARLYRGPSQYAVFPDLVIRARLLPQVIDRFSEIVLQADRSRRYFQKEAQGISGSMPKISQATIEKLAVPLPPLAEQEAIVEEVERRLSILDAVDEEIRRQRARSKQLRRAILQEAFEGRLVPQDPEDEPAEVLLERIRAQKNGKAPAGKKRGRKGGWKAKEGVEEVKMRMQP